MDKNHTPYTLQRPTDFLSQKALERRKKHGISVNWDDLPVSPSYLDSLRKAGAEVRFTSRWFNGAVIQTKDSFAARNKILDRIFAYSFVKGTYNLRKKSETVIKSLPGTESLNLEISHDTDYGEGYKQINMHKGEMLHHLGYQGKGVFIAVIDAGFYRMDSLEAFGNLYRNKQIIDTADFIRTKGGIYGSAWHGTEVTSTIAAYLPGKFIGTAPDANFLLLRSEDADSEYPIEEDAWVAAAEFADSAGADIISSSLGYTTFDDPSLNNEHKDMDGKTLRISRAATMASQRGIIVLNSAGNDGIYPWKYIGAPADAEGILTVGAVDSFGKIGSFSSIGPTADGRIKPDVVAMGKKAIVVYPEDGSLSRLSGTSISCPILAGLTACLCQAFPAKKNTEIMDAIRRSGDHAMNPDNSYGYGIPDYLLAYHLLKDSLPTEDFDYIFQLYPNPFSPYLNLNFFSEKEQDISISYTDQLGRQMGSQSYHTGHGLMNLRLTDFQGWHDGMYLVTIRTSSHSYTRKVVKDSRVNGRL